MLKEFHTGKDVRTATSFSFERLYKTKKKKTAENRPTQVSPRNR